MSNLVVISGCMFAGKTEELLRRVRYAGFAQKRVLLCKPRLDVRYEAQNVASHNGSQLRAELVQNISEVDVLIQKTEAQVVGIDEAQFVAGDLASFCAQQMSKGITLILAGLDLDYRGLPFLEPQLFSIASEVVKLHAACHVCGAAAYRTQRLTASTARIAVGGAESYEARCWLHWFGESLVSESKNGMMSEEGRAVP